MRAQTDSDRFFLDIGAPAGKKDLQLTIPTNGILHMAFIRSVSATSNEVATVHVSEFYGEKTGNGLHIRPLTTNLLFSPTQAIGSFGLEAPQPTIEDKYVGSLTVMGDGMSPIVWRLVLTRATGYLEHPASLIVIPQKAPFVVTRDILPFRTTNPPPPNRAATLRNTDRYWPIEGLAVVPGEITAGDRNALRFGEHVFFYLNGKHIPDLTQLSRDKSDQDQSRTISPGGQVEFGLGFGNLSAGEYTFELNFKTLNSSDDESRQKLTVNVKVRHSWFWAGLAIILGIVVSFLGYKLLSLYKQRIPLRQRIAALERSEGLQDVATYPVVWARMYLRQADELVRRLLLLPASYITERLDRVEPVINALNSLHRLSEALSRLNEAFPKLDKRSLLLRNRFGFVIDRILEQMRTDGMTRTAAEQAKKDLDDLCSTICLELNLEAPPQGVQSMEERYWQELKKAVQRFKKNFKADHLQGSLKTLANQQAQKLWPADAVPDKADDLKRLGFATMYDYDECYARLYLVYERQDNSELIDELHRDYDVPLDKYFAIVDDHTWEALKESGKCAIQLPKLVKDEIAGPAYEPLPFKVTAGNQEIDNSFLFKHKLLYYWEFKVGASILHWRSTTDRPISNSPHVDEFASRKGNLTAFVRMVYNGVQTTAGPSNPIQIVESSDVRLLLREQWTEIVSLLVATGFAVITGLLTFYYKNPIFGSLQDYLSLFIWGAGVDLSKNILQSNAPSTQPAPTAPVKTPPSPPATPPSPPATPPSPPATPPSPPATPPSPPATPPSPPATPPSPPATPPSPPATPPSPPATPPSPPATPPAGAAGRSADGVAGLRGDGVHHGGDERARGEVLAGAAFDVRRNPAR